MTPPAADVAKPPWLLLIHQIPPKPDYLRVKIGRRLQRIGAVAVKNSVYVLPDRPQSLEDFQWIRAEVIGGGGDASICKAGFVDGLTNEQIEHLFRTARDADYADIAESARELRATQRRKDRAIPKQRMGRLEDDLVRLRTRLTAVRSYDFFEATGRAVAEEAIRAAAAALGPETATPQDSSPHADPSAFQGRTWVTRNGIFVDRIASSWLIRRFIDRRARFTFVSQEKYRPVEGELRFDMFEGEFTHEGERCTFETLVERFGLTDPALRAIAELVHDIDLKDGKFAREEAPGIAQVITAIATAHADDEARLERGTHLFDDLYTLFSREATTASRRPAERD